MKNLFLLLSLMTFSMLPLYGQMNFQDSTAQAITYWQVGDKYEYTVNYQKLKYENQDTTLNETMTYEIDISVIDSTEKGYTTRWFYKNIETDSKNPIMQKIIKTSEDVVVNIETDEMGTILGVANWEEVRDYMAIAFDTLSNQMPDVPELKNMIDNMKMMYATKESIEASAILDAHQMHNFHGGKYDLNEEIIGQIKTSNIYNPGNPFDTEVSVTLEKMDQELEQYTIRSINEVDSDQLTETTYKYISKMFKELKKEIPTRDQFTNLTNVVETVSRIHNTGWILESVQWKEVVFESSTQEEIRSIRMK